MAAEAEDGDITFEEQLALERQAQTATDSRSNSERVKVDPDGTVYDWDAEKKAWFPRINEDFIAQYQMSYGTTTSTTEGTGESVKSASENQVDFASIPPMPATDDSSYADWYYKYAAVTATEEYRAWYAYYYGGTESETSPATGQDAGSNPKSDNYPATSYDHDDERYWEQLTEQAAADKEAGVDLVSNNDDSNNQDGGQNEQNGAGSDDKKKKKKVKAPSKPATWFEMQDENNTNIYISGLPPTIDMDSFKDLTNKCGLIAFDPITKKPKLKLYRDADGNPKGDGLCCYIKPESIDLALKILDGYVLDGHTLKVERAKFTLKGDFDPKKRKRRKLTNKEKNAFREKQAKLFEWRPDKPRFARGRNEKTVVIKNVFNPLDIDRNPLLVNEIEEDMKAGCVKYGQVSKVRIHERNTDGAVSVTFSEAEEADLCKQALNGRWFAERKLSAETWDGKTKYDIEETDEQYKERMRKWQEYLDSGGASSQSQADYKSDTSATTGASSVETESSNATANIDSSEKDTGSTAKENDKQVEISGDSSVADQKSAKDDVVNELNDSSTNKTEAMESDDKEVEQT